SANTSICLDGYASEHLLAEEETVVVNFAKNHTFKKSTLAFNIAFLKCKYKFLHLRALSSSSAYSHGN
ncbi:hypothetical protein KS419_14415, partial [Bacillus tamaricis]